MPRRASPSRRRSAGPKMFRLHTSQLTYSATVDLKEQSVSLLRLRRARMAKPDKRCLEAVPGARCRVQLASCHEFCTSSCTGCSTAPQKRKLNSSTAELVPSSRTFTVWQLCNCERSHMGFLPDRKPGLHRIENWYASTPTNQINFELRY